MVALPPARFTRGDDGDLGPYYKQIRGIPIPSAEEQRALATKYRQGGCTEARERLICGNLRLVLYVARRYAGFGMPLADLVAAGNLGLLLAAEKFDPSRGTSFSAFAAVCIRRAILRAMSEQGCVIRVSADHRRCRKACREAQGRLSAEFGRLATEEELIQETGLSRSAVRSASNTPLVGRASEIDEDPVQQLPDRALNGPDEGASGRELTERLAECLASLPATEAQALRLCFGLDGRGAKTSLEIAGELQVSRERLGQLLQAGLGRLAVMLGRPNATDASDGAASRLAG